MIRRAGSASPEAISAERTRSRASETALSGRPTMAKAGRPGTICTCTSTARASIPSKATVETRWTMPLPAAIQGSGKKSVGQEHYGNKKWGRPMGRPQPSPLELHIHRLGIIAETVAVLGDVAIAGPGEVVGHDRDFLGCQHVQKPYPRRGRLLRIGVVGEFHPGLLHQQHRMVGEVAEE